MAARRNLRVCSTLYIVLYFSLQDLLKFVKFYVCVGKFLCQNNFLGPRSTEDNEDNGALPNPSRRGVLHGSKFA